MEHLNNYVDRLKKVGIKNHLPCYTLGLLPPNRHSKNLITGIPLELSLIIIDP